MKLGDTTRHLSRLSSRKENSERRKHTLTRVSLDELATRSPDGFRCKGSQESEEIHCLWAEMACPSCLPVLGSHNRISPFLSPDAKRRPAEATRRERIAPCTMHLTPYALLEREVK